jgi:AmiR/NasT family two-component response regulator
MIAGPQGEYFDIVIGAATNLIAAEIESDKREAFALLTMSAMATNQTLEETALDVLDKIIRFGS